MEDINSKSIEQVFVIKLSELDSALRRQVFRLTRDIPDFEKITPEPLLSRSANLLLRFQPQQGVRRQKVKTR